MILIGIFEVRSCVFPLRCNQGVGINRVPSPWNDGRSCVGKLGEGGGWVVGVTVWVLGGVEGGTLVPGQRGTVLDA